MQLSRMPLGICLAGIALGCTTHDYENELGRLGGQLPDARVEFRDASQEPDADPLDSSPPDVAADVEAGIARDTGADVDSGPPLVAFCEAFRVMKVCRRCHQAPSPVGAPFPLQKWEDTQQMYLNKLIYQRMQRALEIDFMPLRTLPIELVNPPIQPLDPTCKNTLLTWLRQGAKPVGGTDCDPNLSCEGCTNFPPP